MEIRNGGRAKRTMEDHAREAGWTQTGARLPDVVFDEVCRLASRMATVSAAMIGLKPDIRRAAGLPSLVAADHRQIAGSSDPYVVVAAQTAAGTFAKTTDREGRSCLDLPLDLPTDAFAGVLRLTGSGRPPSIRADNGQLASLAAIASAHLRVLVAGRQAADEASLYRLMTENSTDTLVRGNLDGVRLYISPSVRRLLGYEPDELVGRRAAEIVHPEDAEAFRQVLRDLREGRIEEGVSEQRQRHKDGSWIWIEALIKRTIDATGLPDGYVVSVRDISKRKSTETRLEHLASHDALTNLPNRSLVHAFLRRTLSQDASDSLPFAVLYLDLDRFKPINDTFGHEAGDLILRKVADRFRGALRKDDLIARVGGDEFVVVTGKIGRAAATALASRLIAIAAEPIAISEDVEIGIGLSIGIAFTANAGRDPDFLIKNADRSLYAAKSSGRNTYRMVDC